MAQTVTQPVTPELHGYEKTIFRFFFLYFLIQILPIDGGFWRHLFSTNWLHFGYRDIFYLARYQPQFLPGGPSFANWVVIGVLAAAGTVAWTYRDRSLRNYQALYYWLRVLLRYRLALALIAYGFIKFFPLQAPPPSLSHLNTNYGDFTTWKLFSLSLGVVPDYQSFLGLVELVGGLLLLHRKTATIATLIILPFTGNVFFSNLAYEGGEYVYSLYLIAIATYLFAFDAIRLFNLISLERPTAPNFFRPVLALPWQKTARIVLKSAFILLFVCLYGFKTYSGYREGSYQYPTRAGLPGTEGAYLVSSFRAGNQEIPFSDIDPVRWKGVVFEKWNTLSIESNRPVVRTDVNTEEIYDNDEARDYEFTGTQGRHYYSYEADTVQHQLLLKNRNPQHAGDTFVLHYDRSAEGNIVLSGIDSARDSVYAVLQKIDKPYLLYEAKKTGRRKGLTL
jgi:hypothetical protein